VTFHRHTGGVGGAARGTGSLLAPSGGKGTGGRGVDVPVAQAVAQAQRQAGGGDLSKTSQLSLHKIVFRFKALLWESIIRVSPLPACKAYSIAILLHDHWPIYALLPTPLLYAVNHTIWVMTISRKGQSGLGLTRGGRGAGGRGVDVAVAQAVAQAQRQGGGGDTYV